MKIKKLFLPLGVVLISGTFSFGQWTTSGSTVLLNPTNRNLSVVPASSLSLSSGYYFNFEPLSTTANADVFRIKSARNNTFTGALLRVDNSVGNKFIIKGSGFVGISTDPQFRLDVDGADANGVIANFKNISSRVFIVSKTYGGAFNWSTVQNDNGIFWSDGLAGGGQNSTSGLILAPHQASASCIRIDGSTGNVSIGTHDAKGYKLAVNGGMIATSVTVKLHANWPDYVFHENYKLYNISELEAFIKANKHLPNIPSGSEIEKNGLDVGSVQIKQMEKIEELALYIIELNKRIAELEKLQAKK